MLSNLRDILTRKGDPVRVERTDSSSVLRANDNENSISASAEGFICPMCLSGFPNADELQNHYESSHNEDITTVVNEGRNTFSCSACKMKLGSDIELQSHYSRHHASKEQNEAEVLKIQVQVLIEGKALLQKELEVTQLKLQEYVNECAKLHKENDSIRSEANKLTEELANLKANHQELISKNKRIEWEMDNANKKIKELEVEILQRSEADDVKVSKQELVSLQKIMEQQVSLHEKEKEALLIKYKKDLDAQTKSKQEIEKLRVDVKNAKEEIQQLKIGREKLFCKIEEGEGANTALMQLKEEISRITEDSIQERSISDEIVKKLNQKLDDLHCELNSAIKKLEETSNLNNKLSSDLKEARKTLSEAETEKKYLCSQLTEQKSQIDEKIASHAFQLKKLEKDLDSARKELNVKTEQYNKIHHEWNKAVAKLEETSNLNRKLSNDVKEAKKALSEAECDKESLCSQLTKQKNQMDGKIASHTSQIKKLESDIDSARNKLKEKTEQYDKIQREWNKLSSNLNDELTCQGKEVEQLKSELESCNAVKHSLSKELTAFQESYSKKESLCQQYEREIDEIKKLYAEEKESHNKVMVELQNAKVNEKLSLQKEFDQVKSTYQKNIEEKNEIIKEYELDAKELKKAVVDMSSKMEVLKAASIQSEQDWEEKASRYVAQIGILTENTNTLQEDLKSVQSLYNQVKEKLVEMSGNKLELEAKFENALEERKALVDRCLKSETETENLVKRNTDLRRRLDDCNAALHELGRENQTLQVENMKHMGRKWADDSEVTHCTACGKLFTVTIRKHHCRNCGDIFCSECSSKTATVASSRKPVRVCQVCYAELSK